MNKKLSRRDFLKLAGVTSAGLALSACGVNATELPTATSLLPTSTPLPTETITPTLTSTPIPLEQLSQTKQALAEFVQAFQAAGVDISSDQLTQKEMKIRTITGKNGKQLNVALVSQNEGEYPLLIKGEQDWERATAKKLIELTGSLDFGTMILSNQMRDNSKVKDIYANEFNTALIDWHFQMAQLSPTKDSFSLEKASSLMSFVESNHLKLFGQSAVWGAFYIPDWLKQGNYTKQELVTILENHVKKFVNIPGLDYATIVNEYKNQETGDFWNERLGYSYIHTAFLAAKTANDKIPLIYSDYGNNIQGSDRYNQTLAIVNDLKAESLIDGVGLHMRVDGGKPQTKNEIIEMMKSYEMDVYITEMTVDMTNVNGKDRFLTQARIYKTIMDACLESEVCKTLLVFGVGDKYNYVEVDRNKPNADPTLFDDNYDRKLGYYEIMRSLFEHA